MWNWPTSFPNDPKCIEAIEHLFVKKIATTTPGDHNKACAVITSILNN